MKRKGGKTVPATVVVVVVDVRFGAQCERAVAYALAVAHTQHVVIELLLQAALVLHNDLRWVFAIPTAVVVEPHTQFFPLLIEDAIAEIYPEVGLRAGAHIQITSLVAEVVGSAVAIGQQRGNRGRDIDG